MHIVNLRTATPVGSRPKKLQNPRTHGKVADTLVEDYDWDEEKAEEAVAAWRDSGSDGGWDAAAIAESIHRASEDED
jgi:hypothetical protein